MQNDDASQQLKCESSMNGAAATQTPCEVALGLMHQLATQTRGVGLAAGRLQIVAVHQDTQWEKMSQAIKPLRVELDDSMEQWERVHRELQTHKMSHGC